MSRPNAHVFVCCLLAAHAAAQVPAGDALVVARTPANTTQLVVVDLAGTVQPIPPSPAQRAEPLAVMVDPVDRDIILAVRASTSTSRIVRLELAGTTVQRETTLATLTGTVADLGLGIGDQIVAAVRGTAGGLVTLDRRRPSTPTSILALSEACDSEIIGRTRDLVYVARCGTASRPPEAHYYAMSTGAAVWAPVPLTGLASPEVTGFHALLSRIPIGFLTDDGGQLWRADLATGVSTPIATAPALPPGGTVALLADPTSVTSLLGLGGAAAPFLRRIDPLVVTPTWTNLAGPLPGDPIDFDLAPDGVSVPFGDACQLDLAAAGGASIGSPTAVVAVGSIPGAIALGLGIDDRRLGNQALPRALTAGACRLHIAPQTFVAGVSTSPLGPSFTLLIPNAPGLVGRMLFGQLYQLDSLGNLRSSGGVAFHIGG